jgi:glycosyltransferase involved in cell wall biosynthesis
LPSTASTSCTSHDYKTDLLTWLAARRTGVRALATAHGWTGHSARERYLYYPATSAAARFPMVLAVSEEIRRELIAHGASPPSGPHAAQRHRPGAFRRRRDEEPRHAHDTAFAGAFVLGAVGRLEPQKRFDLLITAFAGLSRRHPRCSSSSPARERTRSLEATDRLASPWGALPPSSATGRHRGLSSRPRLCSCNRPSTRGTPNVVLEAMALETPVVATDVGGTRELCEDGVHGRIVPAG